MPARMTRPRRSACTTSSCNCASSRACSSSARRRKPLRCSERDAKGRMKKTASYPFCELSQLQFTKETVKMSTADPRDLSITQLGTLMSRFGVCRSERAIETTVAFYTKLFFPLLALLGVLIPAPFCFRFERRYPQALLVFGSLAVLFCFQLVIHASVVLARLPIVRPSPILIAPWAAALFFGMRRIWSMDKS